MSNVIVNTITYCVCLHSYVSSKNDELQLVPGEVVKVTKKADDGWWYGHKIQPANDPKGGWFPSNFTLEPLEPESISLPGQLRYARAEFEYVAKEEDELHLKPGDLITVIVSEEDDGWHKGVLGSRLGLFPLNFVRMITRPEFEKLKNGSKSDLNSSAGGDKSAKFSYKSDVTPQERRASLGHTLSAPALQKEEPVGELKKAIICKAVAIFDYTAQQPDELTLSKGMKIDVFEKDDEGWWTGVNENGKLGVFPFNFVKEVMPEPSATPQVPPAILPKVAEKPPFTKSSSNLVTPQKDLDKPPVTLAPKPSKPALMQSMPSFGVSTSNSGAPPIINAKPNMKIAMPGLVKADSQETIAALEREKAEKKARINESLSNVIKQKPTAASSNNDITLVAPSDAPPVTDEVSKDQKSQRRLSHLTKERPQMPNKRPPSTYGSFATDPDVTLVADSKKFDPNATMKVDLSAPKGPAQHANNHQPAAVIASDNDRKMSLPMLDMEMAPQPGREYTANEVYVMVHREIVKLRTNFEQQLLKEREHRVTLENEIISLKRILYERQ